MGSFITIFIFAIAILFLIRACLMSFVRRIGADAVMTTMMPATAVSLAIPLL